MGAPPDTGSTDLDPDLVLYLMGGPPDTGSTGAPSGPARSSMRSRPLTERSTSPPSNRGREKNVASA